MLPGQTILRSFFVLAAFQAARDFNNPKFFLKLLQRPPHQQPKPGEMSLQDRGLRFSKAIKQRAMEEAEHRCVFCHEKTQPLQGDKKNIRVSTIDHAIPLSRGGSNSILNAQNTCIQCNSFKGVLTTEEFLRERHGEKGLKLIRRK